MRSTLLRFEKDFFKKEKITDEQWLNTTLHDSFQEMGSSGILFSKEEVIQSLLQAKADRPIEIYNFEAAPLPSQCWMVHYITKNVQNELFYRTSIWIEDDGFKLYFHQASKLAVPVPLQIAQ